MGNEDAVSLWVETVINNMLSPLLKLGTRGQEAVLLTCKVCLEYYQSLAEVSDHCIDRLGDLLNVWRALVYIIDFTCVKYIPDAMSFLSVKRGGTGTKLSIAQTVLLVLKSVATYTAMAEDVVATGAATKQNLQKYQSFVKALESTSFIMEVGIFKFLEEFFIYQGSLRAGLAAKLIQALVPQAIKAHARSREIWVPQFLQDPSVEHQDHCQSYINFFECLEVNFQDQQLDSSGMVAEAQSTLFKMKAVLVAEEFKANLSKVNEEWLSTASMAEFEELQASKPALHRAMDGSHSFSVEPQVVAVLQFCQDPKEWSADPHKSCALAMALSWKGLKELQYPDHLHSSVQATLAGIQLQKDSLQLFALGELPKDTVEGDKGLVLTRGVLARVKEVELKMCPELCYVDGLKKEIKSAKGFVKALAEAAVTIKMDQTQEALASLQKLVGAVATKKSTWKDKVKGTDWAEILKVAQKTLMDLPAPEIEACITKADAAMQDLSSYHDMFGLVDVPAGLSEAKAALKVHKALVSEGKIIKVHAEIKEPSKLRRWALREKAALETEDIILWEPFAEKLEDWINLRTT